MGLQQGGCCLAELEADRAMCAILSARMCTHSSGEVWWGSAPSASVLDLGITLNGYRSTIHTKSCGRSQPIALHGKEG